MTYLYIIICINQIPKQVKNARKLNQQRLLLDNAKEKQKEL